MNILITGGSTGLGAACVRHLATDKGNHIYFTYARSSEAANQLTASFENVTAFHCDFTNTESVDSFVQSLENIALDVLLNNASLTFPKEYFHKSDPIKFLSSFENNILPVIKITQAAITIFRKKKSGKIITILSSALINKPPVGWSEYVANKNYILSLSKSWATENIKFNISSNCLSPSFMETGFTSDTDSRIVEQMINDHPLKRLLTVQEVVKALSFLVNASLHINGINLVMNAGTDI